MFGFFVGDLGRVGLISGEVKGTYLPPVTGPGLDPSRPGTKPMAECRAQIELGLEIFEVQRELENGDVHVGLRRQSAGPAKACRAKGGRARRPQPEAAKKISPRRAFRRMTNVRLTKIRRPVPSH